MLLRLLLLFVFSVFSCVPNGFARPTDIPENDERKLKKSRREPVAENDKENRPFVQTVLPTPVVSSTSGGYESQSFPLSPCSQEKRIWSPVKNEMAPKKHKRALSSPIVRDTIRRSLKLGYFFTCSRFEGKTVHFSNILFDPHALVLNHDGNCWESNLERMLRGRSPIGHKGIVSEEERNSLTTQQIWSKQRAYRIDMQHMTQKDTGTDDDPICEMTHTAHMGYDTYFVLEIDPLTENIRIVYSNLTKDQALTYTSQNPKYYKCGNVLHFREGESLIDRDAFRIWREAYWKFRAKMFERKCPTTPLRSRKRSFEESENRWDPPSQNSTLSQGDSSSLGSMMSQEGIQFPGTEDDDLFLLTPSPNAAGPNWAFPPQRALEEERF